MMTLLMALGHYMYIWWLHGMAFHLVDAVLFLNIRALASTIYKRIKGLAKLRIALSALHEALPDATSEEIEAYVDECAIFKEPMAKAKKLSCNHLFHLAGLRSWLDQGNDQLAHQIRAGLERQNESRHALPMGTFSNVQQNPSESFALRTCGEQILLLLPRSWAWYILNTKSRYLSSRGLSCIKWLKRVSPALKP
ncbi:hypothetical protein NE237_029903 [Protea cynaroides]|uniref:Uncharacterized protein n=1 Tax=Protea cynaroides TaxID=273540 RepID=A0A9Q0JV93_9MAGN|nr:hypothetical protein NE237_029903 [Protea cynaroides]